MRDLELLATFLEVHRAASITRAAARLGLSQPAVSERIARLEQQTGEALFTRSRAGVIATAAGDRLALRVAEPVDRLREVWAEPLPATTGVVRIGGASDVIAARVVPALAPLAATGLRVEFTLGLADDLLDAAERGELDLVLSSVRRARPGVRYRGLIDEEFALVGAPALARTIDAERLEGDPLAALAHLPLVAYATELPIIRRYWRSQFGRRPANPLAMVVPDLRGVLAAVVAGVGVSALPRYLTDPAVVAGTVEVLHHPAEPPLNTLHLAIPAAAPPTPATTAVIERLTRLAQSWDTL